MRASIPTLVGLFYILVSWPSSAQGDQGDQGEQGGDDEVDVVLFSSSAEKEASGCGSELHKELQLKLDGFDIACLEAEGARAPTLDAGFSVPSLAGRELPDAPVWIWIDSEGALRIVRLGEDGEIVFSDESPADPSPDITALYVHELVVLKWNIKPSRKSETLPPDTSDPAPEPAPQPAPEPAPTTSEEAADDAASSALDDTSDRIADSLLVVDLAGGMAVLHWGGSSWKGELGGELLVGMLHTSGFRLAGSLSSQGRRWSPSTAKGASTWSIAAGLDTGFLFFAGRFYGGPVVCAELSRTAAKVDQTDQGEFSYAWWRFSLGAGLRGGLEVSEHFSLFATVRAKYFFGSDSVTRESDGETVIGTPHTRLLLGLGLSWKK